MRAKQDKRELTFSYMTDETQEGRDAFPEDRDPDWDDFPWHY